MGTALLFADPVDSAPRRNDERLIASKQRFLELQVQRNVAKQKTRKGVAADLFTSLWLQAFRDHRNSKFSKISPGAKRSLSPLLRQR